MFFLISIGVFYKPHAFIAKSVARFLKFLQTLYVSIPKICICEIITFYILYIVYVQIWKKFEYFYTFSTHPYC